MNMLASTDSTIRQRPVGESAGSRIVFLYRGGREKRLVDALAGDGPTEFFYGALELKNSGYNVLVRDINYVDVLEQGVIDRIFEFFFRFDFFPSRVYGPVLASVWRKISDFKDADVIVATTPGIAFAVKMLQTLYRFPAEVVAIQLGLTHHRFSKRRLALNGFFLRRMNSVVYTEAERQRMIQRYGIPEDRIRVNQFGVDTSFWKTERYDPEGYIFALGSDGNRDYELLVQAVEQTERQCIIVTKKEFSTEPPENVKIVRSNWIENTLTDKDIRDLYSGAGLVVIPLKDTTQPSGQSVCLQAMACGRPVILTGTQGLWSRAILRDGETVLLTPAGDLRSLVGNIQSLLSDKRKCMQMADAAREAVCEYATIRHWAKNLLSNLNNPGVQLLK